MKGSSLAGAVASAVCVGSTLMGCGEAPSPPAYSPASVQDAWDNHFKAFGAQNVEDILKDYTEASIIRVYNQECGNSTDYLGVDAIGEFFTELFESLGDGSAVATVTYRDEDGERNPIVEPSEGLDDTANVFLTWKSPGEGKGQIEEATDTFLWGPGYKITKQNIVIRQLGTCKGTVPVNEDPEAPTDPESVAFKVKAGWDNHFAAFAAQDVEAIKNDYTEESIIRIYDWQADSYDRVNGTENIGNFFAELFGKTDPASVNAPLLVKEYADKHVFLVWEANSNPRATDTFLFNDEGKIVRQNIVVYSAPASGAKAVPGAAQIRAIV